MQKITYRHLRGSISGSGINAILERMGRHAFVNAWMSGIQGQNMFSGMLTGAASSLGGAGLTSLKIENVGLLTAGNAVIGGTVSVIGGGKFANGAVTGAFTMLFNHLAHDNNQNGGSSGDLKKESSESANSSGDGYGDTFKERLTNFELWKQALFGGIDDPNVIQISMADNPISLVMPFGQLSKVSLGYKTLGGASKMTMVTTAFFKEIGVSGSLGGRWFTPLGPASNWETLLGRWTPFIMESGLIYNYTKKGTK
ncbi:MAG: hypothetical protein Q8R96_04290 [Bacteroidota bacterium]|nr:hypothetical protein [Bacteroidota bacterium]